MPIDDRTSTQNYPKPNIANTLADDVGRLRTALDDIDADMAAKAPTASPVFTGTAGIPAGSATGPSLYFTGDDNTGIYSPGADQVAITTGGAGRLFVDANGNVGAGQNYGLRRVTLTGESPGADGAYATAQGTLVLNEQGRTGLTDAGGFEFKASTFESGYGAKILGLDNGGVALGNRSNSTTWSERLRIDSSGRVGLGVSSPSSLFHIADAGDITVGTTTGTKIGTATTQKLGFFNKTPVVQPTAVADATDAASVITQLNALLSRLRDLGLIAT